MPDEQSQQPTDPLLDLAKSLVSSLVELKRTLVIRGEPLTPKNMTVQLHSVLSASPLMQKKAKSIRAPRSSAAPKISAMSDDEFVAFLEAKPHLKGIDVRREIGKCQLHFETIGVTPSRQRIIKWLNKADSFLGYNGRGQSSVAPKKPEAIMAEPIGWRDWVRNNATDPSNAEKRWEDLGYVARAYIREQMQKSA